MNRPLLIPLLLSSLCLSASVVSSAQAAEKPLYNRDVRPILAENCFACHGPDSAARKAGLRLDIRDEAVKKAAIVPGNLEKSALIERIFHDAPSKLMPPPKTHKVLTAAQKETLKQWVASGAEYQPHWSFIAPQRPELPAVKDEKWVRNAIDRFILAELEKRGLKPAAEADRRTLARRLSLDLTGLPPSPEDVEAFVNDTSAEAYEKYVDKLMTSPHWGEHRGRYWLDAARYADTHGIHFDNYREVWAYRDWVINAFNKNQPFDKFTIEQLAGDLLPNRTLDQHVASGFNRCNITTNEGGAISEEYLVLYARDRTETTGQVWMGMTVGCCVCHDHKFDPMTQHDFYALSAFFNNTTQNAMDGNIKDTPPTIPVPLMQDRSRFEELGRQLVVARKETEAVREAARAEFNTWQKDAKAAPLFAAIPRDGLRFHALLAEGGGNSVIATIDGQQRPIVPAKPAAWQAGHLAPQALTVKPNAVLAVEDAGDLEKDQGFTYAAWVRLTNPNLVGAIASRMDEANAHRGWDLWVEQGRVGTHIINKFPDDAIKVVSQAKVKANAWTHVCVTYDGSSKATGVKIYIDGVLQTARNVTQDTLNNTIRTTVPLKIGQRNTSSPLTDAGIQDLRIYDRTLSDDDVAALAGGTRAAWVLSKPADKRVDAERNELFDWWLPGHSPQFTAIRQRQQALEQEEAVIKARGTVAHVMTERDGDATAHILFRGDYDKRRDQVKADTPKALPAMPGDLPRNRLGLAQWLLRPDHPLTARVTVNRFWQEVYGTGLVRTSGDFGITGELPSHPELLDWMAVEFREGGWDVKKFFKMIVMSSTYRQSAVITPEKKEKDPFNRLLSRGPRFRMDAEMIRDYALASSGILVPKLGGPSVKPYQPDGVWEAVAMIGSNTRDYKRDAGENLYRRSMYTFWKRAAPPASMDILNAPNRETCAVRRERTNTPLQALVTLNDVQFVEAARFLAEKAIKEGGTTKEARIEFIGERLLARPFRAQEMAIVQKSLAELLDYYGSHAEDAKKLITVGEHKSDAALTPSELAAWTMLVNQLMNLDEMLNK